MAMPNLVGVAYPGSPLEFFENCFDTPMFDRK